MLGLASSILLRAATDAAGLALAQEPVGTEVDAGAPVEPVRSAEADALAHAFDNARAGMLQSSLLSTFWEARSWEPAFALPGGLTREGRVLVELLPIAVRHGVDPEWLRLHEIRVALAALDETPDADTATALELALADAAVRFARELRYDNPANAPAGADARQWRDEAVLSLLRAEGDALEAALYGTEPLMPAYEDLVWALDQYRAIQEAGGWPAIDDVLDADSDPASVAELVERLAIEGYLHASHPAVWSDELTAAIARFELAHHLDDDGVLDEDTLDALNVPVHERTAAIIVTLDRMRGSAAGSDGAEYSVRVNVAGFFVDVWDHAARLFHTRAIIGNVSGGGRNRTPLFSDQLERIELNPVWYIPPRLARDLSENVRRGFVRQDGRLIQLPGPSNALGRAKFVFPNSHAVFLHDTSHPELFDETVRAFSSGCVRIADPVGLATLLIARDQGRDEEEVRTWLDEVFATTVTEIVTMETQVPVHLEYYTVWVAADGIVEFYGDIYGLDRDAVRAVSRRRDVEW
jgi:murein L,D-transpeptidase YcbB/YkuD